MTNSINSYPAIIAQRFFCQRLLELLHPQTIDSYRLRVLNPILSLIEVRDIYEGYMQGRIKNEDTLIASIKECITLLKSDKVLVFKSIDKKFILEEALQKITKENCQSHFIDVCHVVNSLLKENKNYSQNLIEALKIHLFNNLGKDPFLQLEEVDTLLGALVTDLIRLGFSKSYLFQYFRIHFLKFIPEEFEKSFLLLESMPTWQTREYKVWFFIDSPRLTESAWEKFSNWTVQKNLEALYPDIVVQREKRGHLFLGITVSALDYFSALQEAKQSLSEMLDIVQLAYHNEKIKVTEYALVVDLSNPSGARRQKVRHLSDGKFPTGHEVLVKLRERLPIVLENENIARETKEKIKSSLRYLRYGIDSYELEHQFINYWIGLEYLFSNEKEGAFSRIKSIFPILQALAYLQRNITDVHQSLKKLPVESWQYFDRNQPQCLLKKEVLEEIRDHIFEDYPLRSYWAWKTLNRLIKKPETNTEEYLGSHLKHLEWHLIRIYRVRNEIVHEAKYSFQNQTLSSNLRYYLAFALSVVLDHFSQNQNEANDLDSYFSLQLFKHKHLKHEKFPHEKLFSLQYDFEMLS